MKPILLLSTSIAALIASSAIAAQYPAIVGPRTGHNPFAVPPANLLYSQNSNWGYAVNSQNFTSGSFTSDNNAAADDFVIPAGRKWKITEVDAPGMYYNGNGPAASEAVTFYDDKKGKPGKTRASYTLNCGSGGYFVCKIPGPHGRGLMLSGGTAGKHFWLSVVANCSIIGGCGQWGWYQNTTTHNDPGQWENPGNGFYTGCTSWTNTSACFFNAGFVDDFAFDLIGTKQ